MISVTKPFLPPLEEYEALVKEIWERNWLTNNGQLVQKLEKKLREYLRVPHLIYVSNGTTALQIAIKILGLKGEIITTPFSYVATTSSIVWEGCKPIFADIDSETLNIDPKNIESLITNKTSAILVTHIFGNPCDIQTIQAIADKYNLKVIYDAASCFGTTYKGGSVLNFGDLSTISFHATKSFHTVEGGAIITKNAALSERISKMRNFGHAGPDNFEGLGINGKNSEFHAAMGLCNLRYIDEVLTKQKKQCEAYNRLLKHSFIKHQKIQADTTCYNYAYYPLIFKNEKTTLKVKKALEAGNVYPRRYFYPSLNKLDYVRSQSVPVSEDISKRILCLPLYYNLTVDEITNICKVILQHANLNGLREVNRFYSTIETNDVPFKI